MVSTAGVAGAVHSVEEFGLEVPDLGPARTFYEAFGLDVRSEGNALGLYTHGMEHRWALITRASRKRLTHLSFGAFESDYEVIARRAREKGAARGLPQAGCSAEGLWLSDPSGLNVRVRAAPKVTPNAKIAPINASAPAGVRAAPATAERPFIRPLRFSHIAVFQPDVPKAVAFYSTILGLPVADHVTDLVAFMRTIHGSDHHVLALAKSSGSGMHHCSWDVGSIDNVALGGRQMEDRGYAYQNAWGPGRHVIGSNYFYYVRDPWGSYAELTADIDYVEAGQPWTDRAYGVEDALYLWGPPPPANFLSNNEVERAA
jgi:catechol 2,3-dioxygenase-like lactoylglutathione lyase family enzyme